MAKQLPTKAIGHRKVTPLKTSGELGKRFPIFAKVEAQCPKCKATVSRDDLTEDYPVPGKPFTVYLYCDKCDEEIPVEMVIELSYRLNL